MELQLPELAEIKAQLSAITQLLTTINASGGMTPAATPTERTWLKASTLATHYDCAPRTMQRILAEGVAQGRIRRIFRTPTGNSTNQPTALYNLADVHASMGQDTTHQP